MNDNVEPFLVPEAHSIRQAMERLEKTEEKIVFVVDGELRLIGSLTDGDIRRWILSDGDLNAQASRVCNRSPYVEKRALEPSRSE
jgi:CBS domain-containing protein